MDERAYGQWCSTNFVDQDERDFVLWWDAQEKPEGRPPKNSVSPARVSERLGEYGLNETTVSRWRSRLTENSGLLINNVNKFTADWSALGDITNVQMHVGYTRSDLKAAGITRGCAA